MQLAQTHQLTRAGYTDSLTRAAAGANKRPAIAWFRAILEDAPIALRLALPPGWRTLGLQHGSRNAPDHVLGWPVVVDTPGEVVLGAPSRLGMDARLSVTAGTDDITFVTAIRFVHPRMFRIWQGIGLPHRVIVAGLVDHAVRSYVPD